jgi:PHD/YefM family antitoxin component YafN of YafNO toxin-antitoxin module
MNSVSISQLKTHPSKAIAGALDYPVAVESRNKVKAYLIGKDLYEKIASYIEDHVDRKAIEETDFSKGEDFEKVAQELGI